MRNGGGNLKRHSGRGVSAETGNEMKAVLTNLGTFGDVYHLMILASELERHGHKTLLAVSPAFETQVKRAGFAFAPVGPDIQAALQTIISTRVEMREFFKSVEEIRRFFAPIADALPQMFTDLQAICREAEVLIAGSTQPVARMIHELSGVPYVAVHFAPPGASTEPTLQQARLAMTNPVRQQVGLPPLLDATTAFASPQLTLYAMSRHVIPRWATWPAHYHITGFLYSDDPLWKPERPLVEFLAAGEAPILVSFGSMTHADPARLTDLLLEAIRLTGRRAILQQGWSGLAQGALPPHVFLVGFAPHGWLFPHAACVVHHGGTGTMGAVFRAGVPQVLVPHLADQPIWAELAHGLNCAGPGVPYTDLTAERLAQAIQTTVADPKYRQAAAALGEKVRAEQGASKARQLIEDLVGRCGLTEKESVWPERLAQGNGADAQVRRDRRINYQHRQRARRREGD
jgi:sterol 3beta-glucosyltransferase